MTEKWDGGNVFSRVKSNAAARRMSFAGTGAAAAMVGVTTPRSEPLGTKGSPSSSNDIYRGDNDLHSAKPVQGSGAARRASHAGVHAFALIFGRDAVDTPNNPIEKQARNANGRSTSAPPERPPRFDMLPGFPTTSLAKAEDPRRGLLNAPFDESFDSNTHVDKLKRTKGVDPDVHRKPGNSDQKRRSSYIGNQVKVRDGGPLGLRHSTDSQRMKEVMDFGVVQKLPKELKCVSFPGPKTAAQIERETQRPETPRGLFNK